LHVRREVAVGKITAAAPEPGEIEAQHPDAVVRQRTRNARRRRNVLAAGEAMREQRQRRRLAIRQLQGAGKKLAVLVGKLDLASDHRTLPRNTHRWAAVYALPHAHTQIWA